MRHVPILLAAFGAVLMLGACGGDDDEKAETEPTERQAVRPISGHFIGKTADGRAAVAVLAEGEGPSRKLVVYVSDGRRTAESFIAQRTANSVRLASEDKDAEVRLKLTKRLAAGTVRLSGQLLAFRAPPRTAGEGLYLATITERGYSARSVSGVRLSGRHAETKSMSTARFPDGSSTPFTVEWSRHVRSGGKILDRPVPGQYRWIVTEGQFFGAKTKAGTSDFIDPPHH